jgi:hypothetical protein
MSARRFAPCQHFRFSPSGLALPRELPVSTVVGIYAPGMATGQLAEVLKAADGGVLKAEAKPERADMLDERKAKALRSSRQVDDSAAHQALDEFDCQRSRAVFDIQDGVDFDHVEGRNYPGFVDELHQEVRLPVG